MNNKALIIAALLFMLPVMANSQNDLSAGSENQTDEQIIYGFVRGGFFINTDKNDNKLDVPSAYTDLALKIDAGGEMFRGYGDIRFRYGVEFGEPVTRIDIREAFVSAGGARWEISAGQKIIKWGRADFTNPTQKLSPQNLISRSMDHEDMDMGNLLLDLKWFPSPVFSIEAVAIPYYRSSTLLIEPLDLPSYVNIRQPGQLITGKDMFTYAAKADFHFSGIDFGFSWFDGYDPLPGVMLNKFVIDTTGLFPVPEADLEMKPYRIRNAGFDFEASAGSYGIRGEAAWTMPKLSFKTHEYVPCEEVKWVLGTDYMKGNWRFTAEYSGKYIPDFTETTVGSFIGSELDPALLAMLLATPGFDIEDYVRQQVGSFNRLYNYQVERSYHSGSLRIESDLFHERLTPSVTVLYNFTSHDLLLMPELTWKPSDGITIYAGGNFLSGKKGSVYDIVDEFMNCFQAGIKLSF